LTISREVKTEGRPIWAEIHVPALEANLRAIRRHLDSGAAAKSCSAAEKETRTDKRVRILAVVKGNGYGHGAEEAAKAFTKAGADWLGVTCSAEGAELRERGIRKPILVLNGFWDGEEQRLIEFNLTPAVMDCSQLVRLERAARRAGRRLRGALSFHLKVDSGMNRLGILPDSIDCLARTLSDCSHLRLTGTFTHLASSEDFASSQTSEQRRVFLAVLNRMRDRKLSPGIVHMANSAAVVSRPETWMDMVRAGTSLYGYHQNYNPRQMRDEATRQVRLQPALSFRTGVVSLRDVPAGEGVGYNARFRATQPVRIAILAAGYADGVPRSLSDCGGVTLKGRFAPLVGVVSMDLAAVNVTGIEDVCVGDIATIYGPDSAGAGTSPKVTTQDASDVARLLGTKTSDVLCMLGKRVPRIYLR
jgi:alanine racemase